MFMHWRFVNGRGRFDIGRSVVVTVMAVMLSPEQLPPMPMVHVTVRMIVRRLAMALRAVALLHMAFVTAAVVAALAAV